MAPVILLVVGIGIALLIALSLFFIPVIIRLTAGKAPGTGYYQFQASWGWIGARMRKEGTRSQQELLLGDHPLFTKVTREGEGPAPEPEKKPGKAPSLQKIPGMLKLIRPFSSLAGKLLRRITLEEVRGSLRVGFRDPAQTGILYGWYWAILPFLALSRVSLDITPVFDREVLEGEIMARIRIDRPLLILFAMARFVMDRDARIALRGLRDG